MQCPSCKAPLIVLEVDQIEIDYCDSCHGTWLDGGELALLLGEAANKDDLMATLTKDVGAKEKRIECPICEKKMAKVRFGVAEGVAVRLDKCPRDHGIWFDEGELNEALSMGQYLEGGKVFELFSEIFGRKGN